MPPSPRFPSSRRPTAAVVLASAAILAGLGASSAAAASPSATVHICMKRVELVETPGGTVVGVVRDGDLVRVLVHDHADRWRRVATRFHTRGWLRTSAICAEDR